VVIKEIEVEYRELRSTGYPSYNNVTHGISLRAQLHDGDTDYDVLAKLQKRAIEEVKIAHGDVVSTTESIVSVAAINELSSRVGLLSNVLRGGFLNGVAKERLEQVEKATQALVDNIPF